MRIVVFGANGPTGRQLVDQALATDHRVVAVTTTAGTPGMLQRIWRGHHESEEAVA